jgi:hypothetical protein
MGTFACKCNNDLTDDNMIMNLNDMSKISKSKSQNPNLNNTSHHNILPKKVKNMDPDKLGKYK